MDGSAIVERLRSVPRSERRVVLESHVVAEFKAALLMADDEELPVTTSFFELGLTSLVLMDVKQRLEDLLDCAISSTVLFNRPTVEQLMEHVTGELLTDFFEADEGRPTDSATETDAVLDDVLRTLYQT